MKIPEPPPRAMRSLPWTGARLASIDFEGTGLDFAKDTIVSFAVVPIDEGMIHVGASTYELVDPQGISPSPESIAVHMLRPSDLAGAPSLDEARENLSAAIAGRFLVMWRAWVDTGYLARIYGSNVRSWKKRCLDVHKLAEALAREEDGTDLALWSLSGVARRYAIPVANPHDALDDALVTAQLFLVVATRLAARGRHTLRDLLATGEAQPPRLFRPRAPF